MNSERLEAQAGMALRGRRWLISAAESCSGGLLLHRLTNIPGSSTYVRGGVVAYANEIKVSLLNVQENTLTIHGAVSEACALEMALGAISRFETDIAVSITGIAGPGGGSAAKPVGLVYVGVAVQGGDRFAERYIFGGDREAIKQQSTDAALRLIIRVAETHK